MAQLVARYLGVVEAASSSLVTQTNFLWKRNKNRVEIVWFQPCFCAFWWCGLCATILYMVLCKSCASPVQGISPLGTNICAKFLFPLHHSLQLCRTLKSLFFWRSTMAYIKERGENTYLVRITIGTDGHESPFRNPVLFIRLSPIFPKQNWKRNWMLSSKRLKMNFKTPWFHITKPVPHQAKCLLQRFCQALSRWFRQHFKSCLISRKNNMFPLSQSSV